VFEYTGEPISTLKSAAKAEVEEGLDIMKNMLEEYDSMNMSDEAARGEILRWAICIDLCDTDENPTIEKADELYRSGEANGPMFKTIEGLLNQID